MRRISPPSNFRSQPFSLFEAVRPAAIPNAVMRYGKRVSTMNKNIGNLCHGFSCKRADAYLRGNVALFNQQIKSVLFAGFIRERK